MLTAGGSPAGTAFAQAPAPAASSPAAPLLDPWQQAVVDSLAFPRRTTPSDLLEAALRAADIEAFDVAIDYVARLATTIDQAGDRTGEVLADLGDAFPAARLAQLDRLLSSREPAVGRVMTAIRSAAAARRRDPVRLAEAAAGLASDDKAIRSEATRRLARGGSAAVPMVVDVLEAAPPDSREATIARELVAVLGSQARDPLLAWLGSDDVSHWAGVLRGLDAAGAADITDLVLAPALVPDTPPAARAAATAILRRQEGSIPSREVALARLARRLDRVLSPGGLPAVDHLMLEPVATPAAAATAFGGSVTGTVDRHVWNPATRSPEPTRLPPRAARAQEAMHLARDLIALDVRDPAAVRLVLLAQLEGLLATTTDPAADPTTLPPAQLRAAASGPDGFDIDTAADLLEEAIDRGLWETAAAVATALEPPAVTTSDDRSPVLPPMRPAVLPPRVRDTLVRALAVPDAAIQFAAARTLARGAGDPPWPGSSRVVAVLDHAATATGVDLAVVVHPDPEVARSLARGLERFGYRTVTARTGREGVFAARASADTTLVLLGARSIMPSPFETAQFLLQQGVGDTPSILVVVDPLDDDGRGRFLQNIILTFADLPCVGIVDRLESFFAPTLDPETGAELAPARFPDALAQAAGPATVDPATRAARVATRKARAEAAATLRGELAERGWDVGGADGARYTAVTHAENR
jgi:CheY-like chemotaxis protein